MDFCFRRNNYRILSLGWLMCCVLLLPPLCGSKWGWHGHTMGFTCSVGFTHGCGPSHLRRSFMAQQRFSVTGDFWRLIIGAACLCASLATAPRFRYGGHANRGLRPQWTSSPAIVHPHLRRSFWLFLPAGHGGLRRWKAP